MPSRRAFLKAIGLSTLAVPLSRRAFSEPVRFAPVPGALRSFEVVTHIEIANPKDAPTRAWVPVPSRDFPDWFQHHETKFSGNATDAALKTDDTSGARFVEASWSGGTLRMLDVVSRFSTRDRAVDGSRRAAVVPLSEAERATYLSETRLVPLDGIVKETSDSITRNERTDLEKLRAIYEWVVDHTHRDAATPGCGTGDVVALLKTGTMGGKCADINALMIGLARAAGIPAREIYGVRVAPSQFGYKSLGTKNEIVTRAQHCRAEAYLEGVGWFPVDPADVRKVALEEPPGHIDMASDRVVAARQTLFGAWEANWLPYNATQDVRLSDSDGGTIPFLMYPQGEIEEVRLNCLDADAFSYKITAREISI